MIRLLNTEELDAVCGGNGVIAGPNGEGCIPPLFPTPPLVPGLPEWLDSFSAN
jgi:hypothetical protein